MFLSIKISTANQLLKYGCNYVNVAVRKDERVISSDDGQQRREHVAVCGFSALTQIQCVASADNSAGSSPVATISEFTQLAGMTPMLSKVYQIINDGIF